MNVNSYNLNVGEIKSKEGFINIPLKLEFDYVDKYEIIKNDFIKKEVTKAINPIIDYEKVKFSLVNYLHQQLKNIYYDLSLLNSIGVMSNTLNDVGFSNDDIKFNKNNFKQSFLKLNFYDNDLPTNQKLLFSISVFCRINKNNLYPPGNINYGLPFDVNLLPFTFILDNPETSKEGFFEGFNLFHLKSDINKSIYMEAQFNNAKNGNVVNFITTDTPQNIENLKNVLYTKYNLIRNSSGFFYEVDTSYSNNVEYTADGNGVKVKLYEVQII